MHWGFGLRMGGSKSIFRDESYGLKSWFFRNFLRMDFRISLKHICISMEKLEIYVQICLFVEK